MLEPEIWYVAYGSNMSSKALQRYLPEGIAPSRTVDVQLNREVYFAGRSKTWGASVAFLALQAGSGLVPARAFLLPNEMLPQIASGENGIEVQAQDLAELVKNLAEGQHATLGFELGEGGYRGKYNALLRLADIDNLPAYTITTARELKRGEPAAAYLNLIQEARRSAA